MSADDSLFGLNENQMAAMRTKCEFAAVARTAALVPALLCKVSR